MSQRLLAFVIAAVTTASSFAQAATFMMASAKGGVDTSLICSQPQTTSPGTLPQYVMFGALLSDFQTVSEDDSTVVVTAAITFGTCEKEVFTPANVTSYMTDVFLNDDGSGALGLGKAFVKVKSASVDGKASLVFKIDKARAFKDDDVRNFEIVFKPYNGAYPEFVWEMRIVSAQPRDLNATN